jgi:hypothetical protein
LKLTIGETSVFEVKKGGVEIVGSCVVLNESTENLAQRLVVAYCLKPGDKVRRISEGEYAVEY